MSLASVRFTQRRKESLQNEGEEEGREEKVPSLSMGEIMNLA